MDKGFMSGFGNIARGIAAAFLAFAAASACQLHAAGRGRPAVGVFPADTPVKRLPGGVKVVGSGDNKIIVAPPPRPNMLEAPSVGKPVSERDPNAPHKQRFTAQSRYAFIPINTYGHDSDFTLKEVATGKVVARGRGVLAPAGDTPDWYMEVDISGYKGRELEFSYVRKTGRAAKLLFTDTYPNRKWTGDYSRPSFHFSPRAGKLMDVGALTHFKGMWHSYYMFDGYSLKGQNRPLTGRAFSPDMMRWAYMPPLNTKLDSTGRADESASSSFVDSKNRSGLFSTPEGGVIFVRNIPGVGDCVSYSPDMQNHYFSAINPILGRSGEYPYLFFDDDSQKWILLRTEKKSVRPSASAARGGKPAGKAESAGGAAPASQTATVASAERAGEKPQPSGASANSAEPAKAPKPGGADEKPVEAVFDGIADDVANSTDIVQVASEDEVRRKASGDTEIAIYAGDSLRSLKRVGTLDADFPSAQLFKMNVTGVPSEPRWVVLSGDGRYYVGSFDGKTFKPDSAEPLRLFHGEFKRLTLWQNDPKGRRIVSGMFQPAPMHIPRDVSEVIKFSGAYTVPYELSLVQVHGGAFQLRAMPCEEFRMSKVLPTDAIGMGGAVINFANNNFMLPDACGNRRAFTGEFNLAECRHTALEVWRHSIGYTKEDNKFKIQKNREDLYEFTPQANSEPTYFGFELLMDSCGLEFISKAGRDVIVVCDNLFEPDYEIRLLSIGRIYVDNMIYYRVLRQPMKFYTPASLNVYEFILRGLN